MNLKANLDPNVIISWSELADISTFSSLRFLHTLHPGLNPLLLLPRQTHGRSVHQVAAWRQTPAQETSYRCHSPGLFLLQPLGPWRRHSAGRDSCSGVRWAGPGYLLVTKRAYAVAGYPLCCMRTLSKWCVSKRVLVVYHILRHGPNGFPVNDFSRHFYKLQNSTSRHSELQLYWDAETMKCISTSATAPLFVLLRLSSRVDG